MDFKECSKDFMSVKEPMLKAGWEKFNNQCEICEMKMVDMSTVISEEFNQKHGTNIQNCSKNFQLMENYQKLLKKYSDLQEVYKYLNRVLKKKNNSKIVITEDAEILGLSLKEQNELLKKRLLEYSDIKELSRKIIRELTPELEKYQHRYQDAFLEGQEQKTTLDAYSIQDQRIEDQFNAEVHRIEKVVEAKLVKGNRIKKKFMILDWKLTREIYPKIRELEKRLCEEREKMVKYEQEIEDLTTKNDEMKTEDESFIELFNELKAEFKKITKDSKNFVYDIKTLLKSIPKVKSEIKKLKQTSEEIVTDLEETNDLKLHFIEEYNQSLINLIEEHKTSTVAELRSQDCLIHGLNCEVKDMNNKLTDSKIQIKILMEDIQNLTCVTKQVVTVMGSDYMGSCFITYVLE
ncbi:unnamed protein product [Diamesa serratosioi]